jgi:methylated-DNA-[protein]-cysteine S-methyltransferase
MSRLTFASPLGAILLTETEDSLSRLEWSDDLFAEGSRLLDEAVRQLSAYFAGRLQKFDLPLAPASSAFQQRVRQAMLDIPFADTRSYGRIAEELGSGPRAIGTACARNPLPILVPCHRIIAGSGALGGYSGGSGIATKRLLLDMEARFALNPTRTSPVFP